MARNLFFSNMKCDSRSEGEQHGDHDAAEHRDRQRLQHLRACAKGEKVGNLSGPTDLFLLPRTVE